MRDDVVASTIQLLTEVVQQHSYVVGEMWSALRAATAQHQPLLQVTAWGVGEYGDMLVTGQASDSQAKVGAEWCGRRSGQGGCRVHGG